MEVELHERGELEAGSAPELEWPRGPPPLGQFGALDETPSWVHQSGVEGWHVRRGHHPGKACVPPLHRAAPPVHLHDVEDIAIDMLAVAHPTQQLRNRQPMPNRDWIQTHEREVPITLWCSFDAGATERVRTIEDHDLGPDFRGDLHGERGRPDVGVVPRANVLQIDHDRIEPPQPLRVRAQVLGVVAIERVDGNIGGVLASHTDHVLRSTRESMLGTEECPNPCPSLRKNQSGGAKRTVDTRRVGQKADVSPRYQTKRLGVTDGDSIEARESARQSTSPTAGGSVDSPANM